MSTPITERLKLLPKHAYVGINRKDPIRFYYWPVVGKLYRRRVELCLSESRGGQRVLEVGFGAGVTFPNLHEKYEQIHGLDLTADIKSLTEAWQSRGIPTDLRNGNVLDMPFPDDYFDTVLLISILEHLKPEHQPKAFSEIRRVLKPAGQVVYGVPVERPLMVVAFRLLGYNIREHHFSTEADVREAAGRLLAQRRIILMKGRPSFTGAVYEVGHFAKT
jgi:SAM-dependent methyltransferase